MKILISGSSGLVGSALIPFFAAKGHEIFPLVRSREKRGPEPVFWDPVSGEIEAERIEGLDAVVHLAGENIASPWTAKKKVRIRESRIKGTELLSRTLSSLKQPPKVFLSVSGVNYYGNRGDEVLTETAEPGKGFLSRVCQDWEAAAAPAKEKGIRVVWLRIAPVLAASGGMLAKMLLPFRMGLGGKISDGRQYVSWIAIDDLVAVIEYCLSQESIVGPINAASPNPVTNAEFTRTLGRVLSRPTPFRIPAFALRATCGEMADDMLLSSIRVVPKRLEEKGYSFRHPHLEEALRHVLAACRT